MTEYTTVAEIIAALGGPKKVADLLKVNESWVKIWPETNQFPGKHKRTITLALPPGTVIADRLFHQRYRGR